MRYSILAAALALGAAGCSDEPEPAIDRATDQSTTERIDPEEETASADSSLPPLAPRNACGDIPGADRFRTDLTRAVRERDADALIALADPDIKLDFGGGAGTAELRRRLTDDEYNLWTELDAVLALGCGPNQAGGITLPWYFTQETPGIDQMMGMIVTGTDVPMLSAADEGAEAVRSLSWNAVELTGGLQSGAAYQHVRLADGITGFVASDRLRSLVDYRLLASEQGGKWRITVFIAGD